MEVMYIYNNVKTAYRYYLIFINFVKLYKIMRKIHEGKFIMSINK